MRYAAFLSYNRGVDLRLSADVTRALQNYAKPWYRLRALRIFRDVSVLSANSDAWGAVERGLAESEFLILFASPGAAASPWVRREIQYWVANRLRDMMLLALTDGEIVWDPGAGDFDWARTTALPAEVLRGVFPHEPNFVDLRPIRPLSGRDRQRALAEVIADLAAPLHHQSKDDMAGEEHRVLRRNRRIAVIAAAALVASTVLALVFGVQSEAARAHADQQRRVALSRQLAAESEGVGDTDPDLARRLAATAWRLDQNADTQQALARGSLLAARHVLRGHQSIIWAMAFSPDGTRLATASNDNTVRVWNTATGAAIATLTGHTAAVHLIAFSSNGLQLATAGDDTTVRVWTAGGALLATIRTADKPQAITFSADDREVRTAAVPADVEAPVISRWDSTTGGLIGTVNTDGLIAFHMAFSPNGQMLAADVGNSVELFNATTGFSAGTIDGHFGLINAIALSTDDNLLAVGLSDGTVSVWKTGTEDQIVARNTQAASVESVAFSADGKTVAAGTADSVVRMWSTSTGDPIPTAASGRGGSVVAMAFSPDGATLATVGQGGTAWLWNVPAAPITALIGPTGPVFGVTFSPDGATVLAASEDGTARLWSSRTGAPVAILHGTGPVGTALFSADGTTVLTADDRAVRLWRATTGAPTISIDDADAVTIALSPDATIIAIGGSGNEVQLRSAATGARLHTLSGHSGPIEAIAFSPNGAIVATASDDKTARLWNTETDAAIVTLTGHTGPVKLVAFSPDRQTVATSSDDGTTRLWNAATGAPIATLASGAAAAMTFSPDGSTLATGDGDGTVRLWNAKSGAVIATLRGHAGPVKAIVYSPDGRTLASGGNDQTVRLWNASTGSSIATLTGHTGAVWSLAFSPDGNTLASAAAGDNTARLWRVSFRGDPYQALCAQIGRALTADEWNQYAPGIPFASVC